MTYTFQAMTSGHWARITSSLKEAWRQRLHKMNWEEMALEGGVAFNAATDSYLCWAPAFVNDKTTGWYFFKMEAKTYCLRMESPVTPTIAFYGDEPTPEIYEKIKRELTAAFHAFGFYGLPHAEKISVTPEFPELKGSKP